MALDVGVAGQSGLRLRAACLPRTRQNGVTRTGIDGRRVAAIYVPVGTGRHVEARWSTGHLEPSTRHSSVSHLTISTAATVEDTEFDEHESSLSLIHI